MSNFYYCNDCKKPVDLKWVQNYSSETINNWTEVCRECGGTNWHAEIAKELITNK